MIDWCWYDGNKDENDTTDESWYIQSWNWKQKFVRIEIMIIFVYLENGRHIDKLGW